MTRREVAEVIGMSIFVLAWTAALGAVLRWGWSW